MPPILNKWIEDLSRPGGCKVWAGSGSRLFVFFRDGTLAGGCQALNHLDLSGGRRPCEPGGLQSRGPHWQRGPEGGLENLFALLHGPRLTQFRI